MSSPLPHIAVLGAGSMGGAVVHGLATSGLATGGITATTRSVTRAAAIAGLDGVTCVALEEHPDANRDAAAAAGIVLIGVKPAMVADLLRDIAGHLTPGTIVVSLAAGIPLSVFEDILGDDIPVLRSMPNTPATVGKAVTGLAAGSTAAADDIALVRTLFATCGEVIDVPEAQIDALSTISGSGPAYVFLLAEKLTDAAVAMGFDREDAALMAEQTMIGAAALLADSDVGPAELRRRVTSPNGTTERAIAVLEDARLDEVFTRAAQAALVRARELADQT